MYKKTFKQIKKKSGETNFLFLYNKLTLNKMKEAFIKIVIFSLF